MPRTEEQIKEDNKLIDDMILVDPKQALNWLKAAFHTHQDQKFQLLDEILEIRKLYLERVLSPVVKPLTVKEAQLLSVCRVCNQPISMGKSPVEAKLNFGKMMFPYAITLNFGQEFAHTECLEKGK